MSQNGHYSTVFNFKQGRFKTSIKIAVELVFRKVVTVIMSFKVQITID